MSVAAYGISAEKRADMDQTAHFAASMIRQKRRQDAKKHFKKHKLNLRSACMAFMGSGFLMRSSKLLTATTTQERWRKPLFA